MTAFSDLVKLQAPELILAFILEPTDSSGTTQKKYVSTARLYTSATDDPANTYFRVAVVKGWNVNRRMCGRGGGGQTYLLGPSEVTVAHIVFSDGNGDLVDWFDLNWNDAPFTAIIGGRIQADGQPYPYSEFVTFLSGVSEDLIVNADGDPELIVSGNAKSLDDDLLTDRYLAFGGAVECGPGYLLAPHAADLAISAITVIIVGKPRLPFTESIPMLAWKGVPGATGQWQIRIVPADEEIEMRADGTGVGQINAPFPNANTWDNGIWAIAMTAESGSAKLYLGEPGKVSLAAEDTDSSIALSSNTEELCICCREQLGGTKDWQPEFDVYLVAIFDAVQSLATIQKFCGGIIADPSSYSDLIRYFKFGEGTGSTASSEVGGDDLTLTGGAFFVSSGTGDDPNQFDGSIAGLTKAYLLGGPARNVPLTGIDSQTHDHQWSGLASTDISRVYSRGAALYPEETLTVAISGDIVITGTPTDRITLGTGFTAKRFIPGQADPAVPGQRIEVFGSVSNDGTYRIKEDGISSDYSTIDVEADDYTGAAGLTNETLPVSAGIKTPDDDAQFSYAVATSKIQASSSGYEQLTTDATGLLGESLALSDAFEEILGTIPDTSLLTFDPSVIVYFEPGSKITKRQALDKLKLAGLAWWIETRSGGYQLGTLAVPSGTPVATIAASSLYSLDSSKVASLTAKIVKLHPPRTKIPAYRVTVGYDPTWLVQTDVVGSVTAARRAALREPYRWAWREDEDIIADYPDSVPETPFETFLATREDAEDFLDLAESLFMSAERRIFEVDVLGFPTMAIDLNDVIILQHPHPNHRLVDGELARVLSIDENPREGITTLEVFV